MFGLLCFLFGMIAGLVVTALGYYILHRAKLAADEQKYHDLWENAMQMMYKGGQLTDEQFASLQPPKELPQLDGFSGDRRESEIARAEQGLAPADNLEGMFSGDQHAVLQARARHAALRARARHRTDG